MKNTIRKRCFSGVDPSRHSPPLPVAYWLHRTPSCRRGVFLPQPVDSGHEPNPADRQSAAGPVPPAPN